MTKTKFRSIRTEIGLTQNQLAKIFGTHVMTISKWERGEHKPDSAAQKLYQVLLILHKKGWLDDVVIQLARR